MLSKLLPTLPEHAPIVGVLLALAILHRRAGDEEAVAASAHQILQATEWVCLGEGGDGDGSDSAGGSDGSDSSDGSDGEDAPPSMILDPGTLALLRCRADALCLLRDYEAQYALMRSAARFSRHPWAEADARVSRYKLAHDAAQIGYLHARGSLDAAAASAAREALSLIHI